MSRTRQTFDAAARLLSVEARPSAQGLHDLQHQRAGLVRLLSHAPPNEQAGAQVSSRIVRAALPELLRPSLELSAADVETVLALSATLQLDQIECVELMLLAFKARALAPMPHAGALACAGRSAQRGGVHGGREGCVRCGGGCATGRTPLPRTPAPRRSTPARR